MIDLNDMAARAKLQKSIKYQYEQNSCVRDRRRELVDLYRDRSSVYNFHINRDGCYVNLFQSFVDGQLVALALRGPSFSVKARSPEGFGLDQRMQNFLNQYSVLVKLSGVFEQIIVDTAFGWGCVKVNNGVVPRGVRGDYGPRVSRVSPNNLITDGTAASFEECGFCSDIYLAPLNDVRALVPHRAEEITEYSYDNISSSSSSSVFNSTDAYPEAFTRLIDVFLPTRKGGGILASWPVRNDSFSEITSPPLLVNEIPFNPYEILSLLPSPPDTTEELSRLSSLKSLHLLTNDMWAKAARQNRKSKRNPMATLGNEHDIQTLANKADTESVLVEAMDKIGLYTLPGADPAVVQMAQMAMQLFSSQGGNLDVALGQATGANTARQTQSLIQQISARQGIYRNKYERFTAHTAEKIMTLAFNNPTLSVPYQQSIPGTNVSYENGWHPPDQIPRTTEINDFTFETVPYSTVFRTPEDRVGIISKVSQELLQWFQIAAATGGLINLGEVMKLYSESYQIPELQLLWSGQPPNPLDKSTGGQYISEGTQGSEVKHSYEGVDKNQGGSQYVGGDIQPAGLQIPQAGGFQ